MDFTGIMEKKMETTILGICLGFRLYRGLMEKNMETTGLGFRV